MNMPQPTPLTQIDSAAVAPQAWRNGGGRTRELLAWPAGPDWRLRLSLADIDADGPFSAFAGVQRWFAVIEGAGVVLGLAAGTQCLTPQSEPMCFDGAEAPGCRLVNGPTRDLNLMLRGGARGRLQRAASGAPWSEAWPWRACFSAGAARWQSDDGRAVELPANTLLCDLGPAPCRLVAHDTQAPMFWIGADIDGVTNALNRPARMPTTQDHRKFYAEFIVRSSGSTDDRLIAAFAEVPREDYVGAGPWQVFVGSGYLPSIGVDPAFLYQDILIGLATDRKINNGQPSLHARCLAAAAPARGESVVHVGAGTGYYTAVLATLVGPEGRVTALEIESDLAARAARNLAHFSNVTVQAASANEASLPHCDVIYVNAGATHPPAAWLDALNVGGRLVFPLTPNEGFGVMLKVTRTAANTYAASAFTRASFIPCIGARDDATSASLAAALERQSLKEVRSLRRNTTPDSTAWCAGADWWLSSAETEAK